MDKTRAAMQQALKALENNLPINYVENGLGEKFPCFSNDPLRESNTRAAIIALREALAEQALQKLSDFHQYMEEGVSSMTFTLEDAIAKYPEISYWRNEFLKHNTTAEQAAQEPVAWVDLEQWQSGEYDCFTSEKVADYMTPLYTAPVRTKDLTDDEISKLRHKIDWTAEWSYVSFARAVIAAGREKNK